VPSGNTPVKERRMEISYFPGCTLKISAKNFEDSALASFAALGVELVEPSRWNCCGVVSSLADDDLVHQVAPIRDLIRVKEEGYNKVAVFCDFCFNTLKNANLLVRNDTEKRDTINRFMDEEIDYNGEVDVVHGLEILRDDIGWEKIAESVKVPLKGLKLAPYYGCMMLRPREVGIDNPENPRILHDLIEALGAKVVDFPFANECCGSFQAVGNPDFALEASWNILSSALRRGAEGLVLSCPLCDFNLGQRQKILMEKYLDFKGIPIFYFTQPLALALGLDSKVCRFELNYGDPQPLLKSKNLLP
jgi:heterodisulfide reductase subunit B